MIPAGWQVKELCQISEFKSGGTPSKKNSTLWGGNIPWVTVRDMKSFEISDSLLKITKEGAKSGTTLVDKDTLLILVRGMALKKGVPVCITKEQSAFNQDIKAVIAKSIQSKYLGYYLISQSNKLQRLVDEAGHGTGRLQTDLLSEFPILIPPDQIQNHYTSIIDLWGSIIELLEKLVEKKLLFSNGLKQQFLSGKRRLPKFNKLWTKQRLGDHLEESRISGGDGLTAKKITVKLYGKGVFPKTDKRVGSANTKYYVRCAGQFIYSKLDFLNGAFGIIPESIDGYETTLDLPCFDIAETINADFLLQLTKQKSFYSRFLSGAAGGRKARRVNPSEFLDTQLPLPPLKEQNAIAQVMSLMDHELDLLIKKLTALKYQKQGLMQQLLTGQIRIKQKK